MPGLPLKNPLLHICVAINALANAKPSWLVQICDSPLPKTELATPAEKTFLKNTKIPTIISLIALIFNTVGNWMLINQWGAPGLVVATTASGLLQMAFSYFFLYTHYQISIHKVQLLFFLKNYIKQLIVTGIPFSIVYFIISFIIRRYFPLYLSLFCLEKIGYWFWMGPLCLLFCIVLWWWRTLFNVRIFFIE